MNRDEFYTNLKENRYLAHYGIKGQKWGIRRFQNEDGTLTPEGKIRYGEPTNSKDFFQQMSKIAKKGNRKVIQNPEVKKILNVIQDSIDENNKLGDELSTQIDSYTKKCSGPDNVKEMASRITKGLNKDQKYYRSYVDLMNDSMDYLREKTYKEKDFGQKLKKYDEENSRLHKSIETLVSNALGDFKDIKVKAIAEYTGGVTKMPAYNAANKAIIDYSKIWEHRPDSSIDLVYSFVYDVVNELDKQGYYIVFD